MTTKKKARKPKPGKHPKGVVNVSVKGYADACQVCKKDAVCHVEVGHFHDGVKREVVLCQRHALDLATQIATRVAVA